VAAICANKDVYISLITALVCDCRLFSDANVSQGSAATHMRCGGVFNKYFPANLLKNLTVKKCENLFRINRITAMSSVSPFFEHDVDY